MHFKSFHENNDQQQECLPITDIDFHGIQDYIRCQAKDI